MIARKVLALLLAGGMGAAAVGVAQARPAGTDLPNRSKYITTNDAEVYRLVLRHCVAEDDFGAGIKVIDYSGDTTTLRCKAH